MITEQSLGRESLTAPWPSESKFDIDDAVIIDIHLHSRQIGEKDARFENSLSRH